MDGTLPGGSNKTRTTPGGGCKIIYFFQNLMLLHVAVTGPLPLDVR